MTIIIDYDHRTKQHEVEVDDYELTDGFLLLEQEDSKEYKSLSDISRFRVEE